jgi:polar amino acid transport system substrate-binding protein
MKKTTLLTACLTAATLLLTTACASGDYAATELPAKPAPTAPAPAPTTTPRKCDDALESIQPTEPNPAPGSNSFPAGSSLDRIRKRGWLIAGVSADSLNLGSRNPISGVIEGFDIDMVRAVAQAIFGDPTKIELRVISSPQRIPSLRDNSVDIVARNMTINCDRWTQIAFSAEYYHSGQKVLVQRDSTAKSLADLSGKTICAPAGSTSLDNLRSKYPKVTPITADTDTGCLVLFQQGKAFGITGDDTVLAGEAAQDPYARVIQALPFSDEPYGLGIALTNSDLVRYVNNVLDGMKADGRWMASYNKWLAPALGPLSAPPKSLYGRTPAPQ